MRSAAACRSIRRRPVRSPAPRTLAARSADISRDGIIYVTGPSNRCAKGSGQREREADGGIAHQPVSGIDQSRINGEFYTSLRANCVNQCHPPTGVCVKQCQRRSVPNPMYGTCHAVDNCGDLSGTSGYPAIVVTKAQGHFGARNMAPSRDPIALLGGCSVPVRLLPLDVKQHRGASASTLGRSDQVGRARTHG